MAKLLFLSGSVRAASYNALLAKNASERARLAGAEATLLNLRDYPLPIYDGDLESADGIPATVHDFAGVVKAHQGIFFACPEYNAGITPLLKNTIDWLSRLSGAESVFPPVGGRVYALGGASPGGLGGIRGMITVRQTLAVGLGQQVLGSQVLVPNCGSAFDADGVLTAERSLAALDQMMVELNKAAASVAIG